MLGRRGAAGIRDSARRRLLGSRLALALMDRLNILLLSRRTRRAGRSCLRVDVAHVQGFTFALRAADLEDAFLDDHALGSTGAHVHREHVQGRIEQKVKIVVLRISGLDCHVGRKDVARFGEQTEGVVDPP